MLDGEPLAARAARVLRDGGCDLVAVVLGPVDVDLPAADLVVHHQRWDDGLGSSLRAGLGALGGRGHDQVMVVLCDQPGIGAAVVQAVRLGAGAGPQDVAMATFGGVRSHPVLIGSDHWVGVAAFARGDVGARGYLSRHPDLVTEVPCDGLGDPADVDHPHQLPD